MSFSLLIDWLRNKISLIRFSVVVTLLMPLIHPMRETYEYTNHFTLFFYEAFVLSILLTIFLKDCLVWSNFQFSLV